MRHLLKNSAIISLGIICVALGNYAFHPIIAHYLTMEAFGELQSILALLYIIGIPAATLGLLTKKNTSYLYSRHELAKIRSIRNWLNLLFLKIGIIGMIVITLLTPILSAFLNLSDKTPLFFLGFLFLFSLLTTINTGILDGMQRFHWTSFNNFLATGTKIIAAIILLSIGFGVVGAMIAICMAYLIPYCLTFIQSHDLDKSKPIGQKTKKLFLKHSLTTFLNLLSITMLYSWDIILIKHLMPSDIAGQYTALSIFGKIILFATGPIHQALFPMAAGLMAQWKKQNLLVLQSLLLVFLAGSAITAAFYYFPNFIVNTLMGENFLPISAYLGMIAVIFTILSLSNTLIQFFISTENTKAYYFLFISLALMSIGLYLFHGSLNEVLKIIMAVQIFTFLSLLSYLGIITQKNLHERSFSSISGI